MENILITGGAGFIGSNFVHYCLEEVGVDRIVVIDALTYAGNRQNLGPAAHDPRFRFVEGDICDTDLVADLLEEERIRVVVNFAAESHVDRSISDPDGFIRTNVLGTHALLKAARGAWSRDGSIRGHARFHHVSTDEVFGTLEFGDSPFTEQHPYRPNSPYSASKAASDHLVRAYLHTYGLPVTTSNCSNNYGPYQFPEKLIPLMIVSALRGKLLPVYGNGNNVRDWLHVHDHCRALDAIIARGIVGKTYNVGGRSERRNIDVVGQLCREIDNRFRTDPRLARRFELCPAANGEPTESLIRYVNDRPGHDLRYAIDAALISEDLGFEPAEDFDSGLRKTVCWYLDNEDWWRAVLDGTYLLGNRAPARPVELALR